MTGLSFEFFPPRSDEGLCRLRQVNHRLAVHRPDYVSVTFGAGGSTRDGTRQTLDSLRDDGTTTAAHLCFSGVDGTELTTYADALWRAGHRKLVALRGDAEPCGSEPHSDVAGFVRALRAQHPFEIAVACYPETHPRAASSRADVAALLAKQEAGASHAISQLFFDVDLFVDFERRARSAGVTIPIVPGILPIYDIEKAIGFADKCGSTVPQWVRDEYLTALRAGTDPMEVSRALVVDQVRALRDEGVEHLHVYTLNRSELAYLAASEFRRERLARAA